MLIETPENGCGVDVETGLCVVLIVTRCGADGDGR